MPASDLRWRLSDDGGDGDGGPQGALFDDVVERHMGRGEYRGMEFLHVNARRIINEVPAASRMPFRFTINAYRGCSHACVYCLSGETPILMGDGRTTVLGEVRVGDEVYGTVRRGAYRRYVRTGVLDVWSTVKPAYRVTLGDSTLLVASGDHRFLTDRGWKHVTGVQHGLARRPHLTTANRLMGMGALAAGPDHTDEYRRGYLCGMVRGDAHLGSYSYDRLALVDLEALQRSRRYLATAGIVSTEFTLQAAVGDRLPITAIRTSARAAVSAVSALVEWPQAPTSDWCKGFLAGIYDAEGSYSGGILRITNADPVILDRTASCLRGLGFDCVIEPTKRPDGCRAVRVRGGMAAHLRFFITVDPAISRKRALEGRAVKTTAHLEVVSIEPMGTMELIDITTGTADFIANGVVSHNCFARPTHEYLGMDAGEDFEKRIVVKVNAVERLRAELAPARWGGEHIAMGTNTDPYQRCEAKYRLTQGIVRTLVEAGNPFSILTKSTLILRDLDLLAEAARTTEVRANFSIGTLDEEVWRTTEPGTPHPRLRVEAVAKLNAAGVPCGVLVAPVLPGLSDGDEQLEAVIKACVEAGATFVTPLLLHLRAGVREQYLGWLEKARPELMAEHERLYPKAYAPKAVQEALARRVRALVAKHGGFSVPPTATRYERRAAPAVRPKASKPARQLSLDV